MTETQDKVTRCFDLTTQIVELEVEFDQLKQELSPEELVRLTKLLGKTAQAKMNEAAALKAEAQMKFGNGKK